MAVINKSRLVQYLNLNYNVLFIGLHGVGKTAVVKETFEEANLRWKYFSASTLDPWVDFVGIPKVIDKEDGKHSLQLIRPDYLENDEVDAIFFDELNRAPDKVINAIMELIQFRSINGHKLKNLKVIWAAINPEDDADTYSVNHLDPAHLDRFQVHLNVPYEVDEDYFKRKYPSLASQFITWWKELPLEIRKAVSPRRLDYVAHAHLNNCRLEDFLPFESNVRKLKKLLKSTTFLDELLQIKDVTEAGQFLSDINNAEKVLQMTEEGNKEAKKFFSSYRTLFPEELVASHELEKQKIDYPDKLNFLEAVKLLTSGPDGNYQVQVLINEKLDFSHIYTNGELKNDLLAIRAQDNQMFREFTRRLVRILLGNAHTQTLKKLFWYIGDGDMRKRTNYQIIIAALGHMNEISIAQKKTINKKLYDKKIVPSMNFL